ncbi:DUF389 domain-containing protein [Stieleria varia]|uniref:DUF389 domain-containing protein n=1 Tax=Stieleria varia TaxID=2528005 RepID=A0A5C6B2H5_9BACT|nr:DUF389 domain-containing protein [Stieleria varia]TWU06353.1 hypothetical protein Pla52n_20740 [Stieleria varia]
MSVVLVISSEEQFRSGADWGVRLAEAGDHELHVLILGSDRAVLRKLVESRLEEKLQRQETQLASVAVVPQTLQAVNEFVHNIQCRWLIVMHGVDQHSLQRELFEHASCSTVWLNAVAEPPIGESHLWGLTQSDSGSLSSIGRELLEMEPERFLWTELPDEGAAPKSTEGTSDEESSSPWSIQLQQADALPGDLLLINIQRGRNVDLILDGALELLNSNGEVSVALVRRGPTTVMNWVARLRRWGETVAPSMAREQRIELTKELEVGSQANWEYLGLISAAAMLAAFGLIQNSASVIIGAMLIAPLMTPILGAGLALSVGNRPLFRSAWLTIALGFVGALVSSMLFGLLARTFLEVEVTPEMWSRCRPSPLDFCVGLVGGIAASYARTRSHLSSALAGAAIAAALVPPISTAGLQIAFGEFIRTEDGIPVLGPLLLVTTNVLTIMVGSSFVLWARGIRTQRKQNASDRWTMRTFMLLCTLALLLLASAVKPDAIFPAQEKPAQEKPAQEKPAQEKPAQQEPAD